jgi:hypothetical protein
LPHFVPIRLRSCSLDVDVRAICALQSEEPVSQREYSPPPVLSFQRTSVVDACDMETSSEESNRPQGPWRSLATVTSRVDTLAVSRVCGTPRPS